MPTINIAVYGKKATVEGTPVITCGNSDYIIAFTFDTEWEAHDSKTARFVYVKAGAVQHEDVIFTGDTVEVPVLSDINQVRVGVFAGNLRTTTPARIPCEASILCGSGVVSDPAPDVYNQIMELYQSCLTEIKALDEKVDGLDSGGTSGGGTSSDSELEQRVEDIENSLFSLQLSADGTSYDNIGEAHIADNTYAQETRRIIDEDVAYYLQFDPTGEYHATVDEGYYATREYIKANREYIEELQTGKADKSTLEAITKQTETVPWGEDGKGIDGAGEIIESSDYTISDPMDLPVGTSIVASGSGGTIGVYLYDLDTGVFIGNPAALSSGEEYTLESSAIVRLTSSGNTDALIVKNLVDVIDRLFTLENAEDVDGSGLPAVTTEDNDKVLQVVDGVWAAAAIADTGTGGSAEGVELPENIVLYEESEEDDTLYTDLIDQAISSLEFDVTDEGELGLYYKGVLITSALVGGSGSIEVVKCTGITLDVSEISLTADDATTTIEASVTPLDCTQAVKWYTSDASVVTVSDGVVTVVGEGSATITAICGSYQATCEVTVVDNNVTGWSVNYGRSYSSSTGTAGTNANRAYTQYNGENAGIPIEPSTTYIVELADASYYFGVLTSDADRVFNIDSGWKTGSYTFTSGETDSLLFVNFKYGSSGNTAITAEMAQTIEDALTIRKVVS